MIGPYRPGSARVALTVFAPFTAFLNAAGLEHYFKLLSATGQFPGPDEEGLTDALTQAEKQGLPEEVMPKHYEVRPVLPFFFGQAASPR